MVSQFTFDFRRPSMNAIQKLKSKTKYKVITAARRPCFSHFLSNKEMQLVATMLTNCIVSRDCRNVISNKGADCLSRTIATMATRIENVRSSMRVEAGIVESGDAAVDLGPNPFVFVASE